MRQVRNQPSGEFTIHYTSLHANDYVDELLSTNNNIINNTDRNEINDNIYSSDKSPMLVCAEDTLDHSNHNLLNFGDLVQRDKNDIKDLRTVYVWYYNNHSIKILVL